MALTPLPIVIVIELPQRIALRIEKHGTFGLLRRARLGLLNLFRVGRPSVQVYRDRAPDLTRLGIELAELVHDPIVFLAKALDIAVIVVKDNLFDLTKLVTDGPLDLP